MATHFCMFDLKILLQYPVFWVSIFKTSFIVCIYAWTLLVLNIDSKARENIENISLWKRLIFWNILILLIPHNMHKKSLGFLSDWLQIYPSRNTLFSASFIRFLWINKSQFKRSFSTASCNVVHAYLYHSIPYQRGSYCFIFCQKSLKQTIKLHLSNTLSCTL